MEYLDCLKNRRSVRQFSSEKISEDKLKIIVEEASYAPSWKNSQTVKYLIIENDDIKAKIANILGPRNQEIVTNAPDLTIVLSKKNISGCNHNGSFATNKRHGWEMFDAGIACQTFCLSAFYEGVKTVIMGIFDDDLIRNIIDLSYDYEISALIAMGYSDDQPQMPKRKLVSELLEIR